MSETEAPGFESTDGTDEQDPDVTPIKDRKVVTQPYDLAIDAIVGQVKGDILFLRPLSSRPNFQRQYVWDDKLASKLGECLLDAIYSKKVCRSKLVDAFFYHASKSSLERIRDGSEPDRISLEVFDFIGRDGEIWN